MIPSFNINIYGIMLVSSLIIGFVYIAVGMIKSNIPRETTILCIILLSILTLLGGVYFSFFRNFNDASSLFETGMTASGGAIGMILGIIIINLLYPDIKILVWNIVSISIPLIYSIAKIGCHFAGCCQGIIYSGPFAITYTTGDCAYKSLFPVQITETIVFFIIFIISAYLYYCKKNNNTVLIAIALSSSSKFLLDFLRFERPGTFLSINQYACLFIAIITVIVVQFSCLRKKSNKK